MREPLQTASIFGAREPERPRSSRFGEPGPGAEIRALLRSRDWAHHPLGPIERWPATLCGYLAMILELPTPAVIFWGPEQTQLYNEGYAQIMGPRHPRYLAAPYRECWPDTYPVILPLMQRVLSGEAVRVENELFTLTRYGFTEEAYFTFSFSPLRDDRGELAGILQPVVEVTQSVLRARRAETVRALSSERPAGTGPLAALGGNPKDVPFALLFRPRPGAAALALEDSAGFPVPPGAGAALEHLERLARQVTSSGVAVTLERDEQVRALGHEGPWGEPTLGVCVVPVRRFAGEAARGALVVGLSSRLAFEATYADFLEALARQLAVSIDEAAAAQTERTLLERERDARREAEASRNRLFALFENAPAFVALLEGPRHVFQLVNPLYQRMIGENRTLVGLPVAEAVPEVVDQGFVELLDSVLQAGTPFIGREVPLRLDTRGDGTLRQVYLNFVYQPRCDALGRVEGIDVFGFEVTEEVLARQAVEALAEQLRSSEQNFRVLLESIPQQVWTASVDGALDYVNDQVAGYFEGPREALLGAGWLAFVHPEDQPLTRERWAQSLTTGQPYEHEFRLRRADGEYRWYLARAQAVRGPGGAILRWFGTNTDVDDTKRIREALKRRTEFEQYLVGIVSHDLRSPLNAILLASGALARNPGLDAAAAKAVGRIESATRRAARMIRDLLDFTETRLGGSIPVVRKPIDLREVLRASLEELEAAHPGRRIRVSHQGEPTGEWDGDRMAQVVQNLGANALKYSPGDSEVCIETDALADKVLLRVHNRGTPIASEKLSRIFEPLQRATGEVDPSGRSVGLGLYIVKQILEAHGGSIEVSSTGEGTTFTAQLPRFDAGRAP